MTQIPLGKSDWRRPVRNEPDIPVRNRFFETNPTNLEDQSALLSRPGLKRYLPAGTGPIRQMYSQPGSFSGALFCVSYDTLYKVAPDTTTTALGSGIFGWTLKSTPSMAATANIGTTPEYLYIADGRNLWIYSENSQSIGLLSASGTIVNNDTVQIATVYYKWTTGSVDTGTPAGTIGSPWLVSIGASNTTALANLKAAISANDGGAGTAYSTLTTANPNVVGTASDVNTMKVTAIPIGALGNGLSTTVVAGTSVAWGSTTLTGGGGATLRTVDVPTNAGIISVAYIGGFIVCVVAQGYGYNGRFYWINPGDTFIDPLNFATAERAPDPIVSALAVGDLLWLFGTNSSEVWYLSGDANVPFRRQQGRLFDSGVWPGSPCAIKDSVMVVDPNGFVYRVVNGSPQRVSNHAIEEQLRAAIIDAKNELF